MNRTGYRRETDIKPYTLSCGHTTFFRTAPVSGERLYCVRCQDWPLYAPTKRSYIRRATKPSECKSGHKKTAKNIQVDKHGHERCRKCIATRKRKKRRVA